MRKKILATATVVAVMTSMFAGTAMATEWNTNGGSATVEGGSYTVDPIIEVELPGDLSFGINPLRLDADGDSSTTGDDTQIISTDYLITNYSNVPVSVKTETSISSLGTDVTALATATYDTNTKELEAATDGKKNVFLVQSLPTTISITDGVPALTVAAFDETITDDTSAKSKAATVLSQSANAVIFNLNAFDYETEVLVEDNVSGFRFTGAVDPQSTFVEGDVNVQTVFTLTTLTAKQYTDGYDTDSAYTGVHTSVVEAK